MDIQQFTAICVYVLAGVIGLCVGSFLNVVIYRLPLGMSLSYPGSHCPACGYSLRWYDNIPVISYLLLGGKCRQCRGGISPRYMLVELSNSLLWLLSVYRFYLESPVYTGIACVVSSALICVFFIDLEHMLIFNRFHLILAACGIAAMAFDRGTEWYEHLIGGAAALSLFAALYYGALAILKNEGLGFGDVKYAAAAGLLLGWKKFLLALILASVSGAVVMIASNRIKKTDKRTEYPFGPFLAVGTLLALLFGDGIIHWYFDWVFSFVSI